MRTGLPGFCGIPCDHCPAFNENHQFNDEKRLAVAAEWSTTDGRALGPKEIACEGCRTLDSGKVFVHCRECTIRLNGLGHEHANYAHVVVYMKK